MPSSHRERLQQKRSIRRAQRTLRRAGVEDPTQNTDPGFWSKLFGAMDAAGAWSRAQIYDMGAQIRQEGLQPYTIPFVRYLDPRLYDPQVQARLRAAAKYDPWEEAGRAFGGERRVEGVDIARDMLDIKNPTAQGVAGFAIDIASDPTTYGSLGLGSAAKGAKAAKLAKLGEGAIDAAKLAEHGIDVAELAGRYGDDVVRPLREGGLLAHELPTELSQEIASRIGQQAGLEQAGRARNLFVPFLRRSKDGKLGLRAVVPTIEKVSDEAIDAARELGDRTIGQRLTGMTRHRLGAKVLGTEGERVGFKIGERVADKGGFKFAGRTVLDIQPEIDKAAYAVKAGLRKVPGAKTAEALFNPVADIARTNNPIATETARWLLRNRSIGTNLARHAAIEEGADIAQRIGAEDRNRLSFAINEVLPEESRSVVDAMQAERKRLGERVDDLLSGHDLTTTGEEGAKFARRRAQEAAPAIHANARIERYDAEIARKTAKLADFLESSGLDPQRAEKLRAASLVLQGDRKALMARYKITAAQVDDALANADTLLDDALALGTEEKAHGEAIAALEERLYKLRDEQRSLMGNLKTRGGAQTRDLFVEQGSKARLRQVNREILDAQQKLALAQAKGKALGAGFEGATADVAQLQQAAGSEVGKGSRLADRIFRTDQRIGQIEDVLPTVRALERDISALQHRRALAMQRFDQGVAASNRIDSTISLIGEHRAGMAELDQRIREKLAADVDYDRIEQFMIERGATPEQAAALRAEAEQMRAGHEARNALRVERGIGNEDLLPGMGAAGYVKQTDPERRTLFEMLTGGSEAQKARDAVLADEAARLEAAGRETFDPAALAPREGGSSRFGRVGRAAPTPERDFPTLLDRLRAGVDTQTDIALSHASKVYEDLYAVTKADFEDGVVRSFGRRIDPADARTFPGQGEAAYTITRNGQDVAYVVPAEVKRWIDGIERLGSRDEAAQALLRGYDRVLNSIKRQLTSWRPGFHARNLGSNYFLAWLNDLHQPVGWEDAIEASSGVARLYDVGGERLTREQLIAEATEDGVLKGNFGASEVQQTVNRTVRDRTGKLRGLKPSYVGGKVGAAVEDTSRLAVYINARNKGLDRAAAGLMADKTLYNYSSDMLTGFERDAMKRLVPFYSWLRNNVPAMLEHAIKQPGKIGAFEKLRQSAAAAYPYDDSVAPEYMRELGYVATPFTDPATGNQLMWNAGLPIADLTRLGGDPRDAVSLLSPPLRSLAEMIFDRESFTGREVSRFDGDTTRAPGPVQQLDRLLGGTDVWEDLKERLGLVNVTDNNTGETYVAGNAYAMKALKDFVPIVDTVGRMSDVREGSAYDLLSQLTGIKFSPYDTERFTDADLSRRSRRLADEIRKYRDRDVIAEPH